MKKALLASLFLLTANAYAAIPQEVMNSFKAVEADIKTVGWAIVTLAAVAMGIRWIKAQFF